MKYFFTVLLALLFAGCTKETTIEFTGTAPGISEGQFEIKDGGSDTVVCRTPIKSEKFSIIHELTAPGYYNMAITKADIGTQVFDVYLEPGTYSVTTNAQALYKYPTIRSSSKKQNELTAFYQMFETVNTELFKKGQELDTQLKDPNAKLLPPAVYASLTEKLKAANLQASRSGGAAMMKFVDKYPDNEIAMHLMLNMDYTSDPVTYYGVYKKLSPKEKNSNWGKIMGPLLDSLSKTAGK